MTTCRPNRHPKHNFHTQPPLSQRGGMLIEGMVSIVLISLAGLAVVGLQAQAIRIDSDAQYRHIATLVASDLANEMLLTKKVINDTDTSSWSTQLTKLPNATIEIKDAPHTEQLQNSSVKDVTITWMPPNKKGTERDTLTTRLTIPKESS